MPKRPREFEGGGDDDLDGNFAFESVRDDDSASDVDAPAASASSAAAVTGQSSMKGPSTKKVKVAETSAVVAASSAAAAAPAPVAGKPAQPASNKYVRGSRIEWQELSTEDQANQFWSLFTASTAGKDLTPLEYGEALTAARVASAGGNVTSSNSYDTDDLPRVVKSMLSSWKKLTGGKHGQTPRPKGCPAMLVVCQSAPRAADILRGLAPFGARTAKLFAKHLKPAEQLQSLEGPPVIFAVGTPHRISKLLTAGASPQGVSFSMSHCELVLVDVHRDSKGYTLLDNPATAADFFTLYRDHLHTRIVGKEGQGGRMKIGLY